MVRWLEGLHGPLPYAALLLVAFAEHALLVGTLVPGEVILPLAGVAPGDTPGAGWHGHANSRYLPAKAPAHLH